MLKLLHVSGTRHLPQRRLRDRHDSRGAGEQVQKVQTILERCGEKGYTIGRIMKGEKRVTHQ
ncbi:MAG TPA: hypothetical protein VII95_11010 [Terriglobales bacterium]|jgi:hypothetical protein